MNVFRDVRRLTYFRAIANAGSLSAAARQLNVAQPALTHHVHELEAHIGRPLAKRTARGVELTPAGVAFLDQAEKVLGAIDVADRALRDYLGSEEPVRLRVGLPPSLSPVMVSDLMRLCAEHLPHIRLDLHDTQTKHSETLIAAGAIDCALAFGSGHETDSIFVGSEDLYLVTKFDEDTFEEPITWQDLFDLSFTMPPVGRPIRDVSDATASEHSCKMKVVLETYSLEARKHLVMAGKAATLLPFHSVEAEHQNKRLSVRPLPRPGIRRAIRLILARGIGQSEAESIQTIFEQILSGRRARNMP